MKRRIQHVIIFLLICSACRSQYIFSNLQKKDGLSNTEVFCAIKDQEGFMWFGTAYGLNRYDGSGIRKYRCPQSAISVTTLLNNDPQTLWVGTRDGLYLFDKLSEAFDKIKLWDANDKIVINPVIEKLFYDKHGRLWVISYQGIFIYMDKKFQHVSRLYPSAQIFNNQKLYDARSAYDQLHDGIWVSCEKGLFFLDFKSKETHSKNSAKLDKPLFELSLLYCMALDSVGNIWFSNNEYYLAYYDFKKKTITKSPAIQGIHTYNIFIDSNNRLWINNYSGNLLVLQADQKLIYLPQDCPESFKLCNNIFNSIYEDDNHNLWISGLNGVGKLSSENYIQNIFKLPGNSYDPKAPDLMINRIVSIDDQLVWACKDDGLYQFNITTGKYEWYGINSDEASPKRFFDAHLIEGEWWCGTGRGILIFNQKTKQFKKFTHYHSLYDGKSSVIWILKDQAGLIWYSVWGDAVYRFNPKSMVTDRMIEVCDNVRDGIPVTNSLCAIEKFGKIWINKGESGLVIYDHKTQKFTTPIGLDNFILNGVCPTRKGNLWLATNHGIIEIDQHGQILQRMTSKDKLSIDNTFDVAEDASGNIWVSSMEGLEYFDPIRKMVTKLDIDMGLPIHEANGPILLKDNILVCGVGSKVAVVNIDRITNKAIEPPVISGVSIFGKKFPYAPSKQQLNLAYNQNYFTIDFSSLQHKEVPSLHYAYKLENYDKDWINCERRQNAIYTNIPDGRYTFLVKCTGANGQWMQEETRVEIVIAPPVWKTWWFRLVCLGLSISIVWKIYQYYKKLNQKKDIDNTIDYFVNSVYGHNSVDEICWDIVRNCISILKFEDCIVYLYDKQKDRFIQKAAFGPKNPYGNEIKNPIEIEVGQGIVGAVAQTGRALLIEDTTKDSRYIIDDDVRLSELAVPIIHDNKVIGVIDSEHSRKNYFSADHVNALTKIAAISSTKIAEATSAALVRENELQMLEINKLLAESQLMALRAQMNPHFVFNCLNSIQECIATEKFGEASKYLNKFSKLFRMVLNNSSKQFVTLGEERDVLLLYVELEQMRFEQSFQFNITIDEKLDDEEILIPSMLIQPFVENALWHGLMHKEGERKLEIKFTSLTEEIYVCTIEDNGIGRQRSFELKSTQSKTKHHESKGLAICKDRLDILKRQGIHTAFEIIDKKDNEGAPLGTIIRIELSTDLIKT